MGLDMFSELLSNVCVVTSFYQNFASMSVSFGSFLDFAKNIIPYP